MQKPALSLFLLLLLNLSLQGQKVSSKLHLTAGKTYTITAELTNTTAQLTSSQPIDFSVNSNLIHTYKATSVAEKSSTLHHDVKKMTVVFDGMGKKRSFDSDKKNNPEENIEPLFPGLTGKSFDITIDPTGKTIMTKPETIQFGQSQENTAVITSMLKDLINAIYPPKKGAASFFSVLPAYEVGIGDSWTDSIVTNNERSVSEYKLAAITDSTLIVELKINSSSTEITEVMGRDSKTMLKSTTSCKIILDRTTGVLQEKTCKSQSNGQKEVMGSILPVTGNASLLIKVTVE